MLPNEFTYIDKVHPDIICDLRYFSKLNFTGDIVPGYYANKAIMTKPLEQYSQFVPFSVGVWPLPFSPWMHSTVAAVVEI